MDESRTAALTPLVSPSSSPSSSLPSATPVRTSRPGRAVRVYGINTLQAVCQPNDYVDPYTISSISNSTSPEPLTRRSDHKLTSYKLKHDKLKPCKTSSKEQSENRSNERRERVKHKYEQLEAPEKPPVLPPRAAPPLPPRIRHNSCSRVETLPRPITSSALLPTASSIRRSKSLTRAAHQGSVSNNCAPPRTSSRCSPRPQHGSRCSPHPQHGSRCPPQPAILISTKSSPTMLLEFRKEKSRRVVTRPSCTDNQRGQSITVSASQSATGIKTVNSIICPDCGQCRCRSCRGRCSCNIERLVDTLSCMCCVRGCVSNCTDNHDIEDSEDSPAALSSADPCTCVGSSASCCLRWTMLTTLTLCVPCLLLYWPLKMVERAATSCHSRGCNCDRTP